jgi:GAF domain-containing protein/anti-sigma regulatory factor (Ser/Thr protein kinase)
MQIQTQKLRYSEVVLVEQEINHRLSEVPKLFDKLQSHMGAIFGADHSLQMALYHPQAKTLEIYQTQQGQFTHHLAHQFEGANRYVIENHKPLLIRQMSKEVNHLPFQLGSLENTRSEESFIYVPLISQKEPIGTLSIQHPTPNAYTEEDVTVLELLANHVALAIHNSRLYRNLDILSEAGQILTQQFESPDVLQTIVDTIKEATRADTIVLFCYDQTTKRLLSPHIAGPLTDPQAQSGMLPSHPDNIALLMLKQKNAIFARESVQLYRQLLGDIPPAKRKRFYEHEQLRSTAAVPLYVEDKIVGVLFANFRESQRFYAYQRLLIEGLAHTTAIAIKNAQTFGRLNKRHIQELEALQKIDNALNTPEPELKSVLDIILQLAHDQIASDHSAILLYNAQKQLLTVSACTGPRATVRRTRTPFLLRERGIITWVIQHKETVLVDNVHTSPIWRNIYNKCIETTTSELDIPILDDGEVIGVLNFESAREAAFHQEDVQFLKTLAGQAVLAIKKAQAYEREKLFAKRFRLLYEAAKELGKLTEVDDVRRAYEITLQFAEELSLSPGVIRSYDEETQELTIGYTTWDRDAPLSKIIKLDEGYNGKVMRERQTLLIDDTNLYSTSQFSRPANPTVHSFLIVPIQFQERYYGNLEMSHPIVGHFRDKDQEFFEGLTQQLANTLYRLEIIQQRQQAEIMSLVGLSTFEIAHRLKQDLGLIGHNIKLIKSSLESKLVNSPSCLKMLDYIDDKVANVLKLGENLKSELKAGWGNESPILLPPKVLIEDALNTVPLPETIVIRMEIETNLAPVRVRQNLIVDILRNLVVNAKEAMPNGGTLTLHASTHGRFIAIEVRDTGMGIPPEKHEKIFDLFYSTKQLSSGFGLWSALFNAKRHGGNLKVKSEEGKGATFTLLLPRAEVYSL